MLNIGCLEQIFRSSLFAFHFFSYLCTRFRTDEHWRDGRVVDYSSLENYRTERYRGFESLSLRQVAQMGTLRVPIFRT